MAFEMNELSGMLFKNDRRENDRQPTHTGSCKIEGTEYWISAWVKTSKNGRNFFSMSFTEKDAPKSGGQSPSGNHDYDDDIPF